MKNISNYSYVKTIKQKHVEKCCQTISIRAINMWNSVFNDTPLNFYFNLLKKHRLIVLTHRSYMCCSNRCLQNWKNIMHDCVCAQPSSVCHSKANCGSMNAPHTLALTGGSSSYLLADNILNPVRRLEYCYTVIRNKNVIPNYCWV